VIESGGYYFLERIFGVAFPAVLSKLIVVNIFVAIGAVGKRDACKLPEFFIL
jgi:uncharacterized membrane protein required for colicin V production